VHELDVQWHPQTVKDFLLRDYIDHEMHMHDADRFTIHEPSAGRTVFQTPLVSTGQHHEWSANGHNKLLKLRFLIWGVHNKWSRKGLGLWVIPNNCLKVAIGYLYLTLVKKLGG